MKRALVSCVFLTLWLSLNGPGAWAIDVGWMQQGVRVWYFGSAGSVMSSDAEEAYLFTAINGNTAQLAHHSGINHWSLPTAVTETGSIVDKGPFWIHPQVLQNIAVGDDWMGIEIKSMNRATYTYDTFKNNAEFAAIPYLLLPIKTLFDLKNQREVVKIVYGMPYLDDVWGTAYFDADTGLCLFNLRLTFANTVWFILSEINYDFATQTAFAEDNGPHTGFKSNIVKTSTASHYVMIQSSVETRYGNTVQMWVSTSAGGAGGQSYLPPNENYCFFGNVPVLRHKLMSAIPQYPPENWTAYGQYLWWWVPAGALQKSAINVFDVPMTRTSTNPYTFTAAGAGTSLYFSAIVFDSDGYMTDFAARDQAIGLVIDLGPSASNPAPSASTSVPIHLVDGLAYYKDTMGRAIPVETIYRLTLTVVSDTAGKGGGLVYNSGSGISCGNTGSDPNTKSGVCQADLSSGTSVTLTQSPDGNSTWAAWSASGCGTNQDCQVVMNGAINVTATFPYAYMAKVNSTAHRFDSLTGALADAAATDTILARDVTFIEGVTISNKSITLIGGQSPWYLPQNAWTTLNGPLAIQSGSLTVEKLLIE